MEYEGNLGPYGSNAVGCPVAKPKSVDFWEQHEAALRAGRIVQAAAIIYAGTGHTVEGAVMIAFDIDKEVQRRIEQEKK